MVGETWEQIYRLKPSRFPKNPVATGGYGEFLTFLPYEVRVKRRDVKNKLMDRIEALCCKMIGITLPYAVLIA